MIFIFLEGKEQEKKYNKMLKGNTVLQSDKSLVDHDYFYITCMCNYLGWKWFHDDDFRLAPYFGEITIYIDLYLQLFIASFDQTHK